MHTMRPAHAIASAQLESSTANANEQLGERAGHFPVISALLWQEQDVGGVQERAVPPGRAHF